MTAADYDAVIQLWSASEGVGLGKADTREAITFFLERNPSLSPVAIDGQSRIIGAVLCGHDARRGYLHHLAVAKIWRGRGIGRALVEECLKPLRAFGIEKCNIHVYTSNAQGQQFWLREGFAARDDLTLMQKILL